MSVATPIPIADGELKRIPLEQLVESPLNPRRHYDPAALDELAASLATSGQVTPVLVRPTMGGKKFELAAGHRRYRAAKQAKLPALLAVVRELDEAAFLEVLTVENLQRDDLDPLEEADGFRTLMTSAGYDVPKLAQRCGRSTRYVYDRLKLLQLVPVAQDLLRTGLITLEHAVILARLSADDQTKVIGAPEDVGYSRSNSGLFVMEHSLWSPHDETDSASNDAEDVDATTAWAGCKAVTPKELQGYIDQHIRFDVALDPDPMLFPETAEALEEAETSDLKVIHITYQHQLRDSARLNGVRTYGPQSWKRADGERGSKPCDVSAKLLGIVVAGPDRGQAFRVCTAKKTCKVHWAAEIREAAKRAKGADEPRGAATVDRWELQRKKEELDRARWVSAREELQKALKEAIAGADASPSGLLTSILFTRAFGTDKKKHPMPQTYEEVLRALVHWEIAEDLDASNGDWYLKDSATRALKLFGISAAAIVDRVAPKAKAPKAASKDAKPAKASTKAKKSKKAKAA